MDKEIKQSLRVAAIKSERIVVWLLNGNKIKGIAEVTADPERVKINTDTGPVWVPINDVESVSQVIRLRVEGIADEQSPRHGRQG